MIKTLITLCIVLVVTYSSHSSEPDHVTHPQSDPEISVIYSTDLWSPYGDPDDQFDLITLFSVKQLNIKAVILDNTMKVESDQKPNFLAVSKATALLNRSDIPCQAGLRQKLQSTLDPGRDHPAEYQQGIELIINKLRTLQDNTAIIITTGSLRDICAAYNLEPSLFRKKVKKLIISIGDSYGIAGTKDTNVAKDIEAWKGLMNSGLSIDWMPCNPSKWRGGPSRYVSYWYFIQSELLSHCPENIQQFFISENITIDSEQPRHMWSTPAFIEAAGLKCYQTGTKFKWMSPGEAGNMSNAERVEPYEFKPVTFSLDEDGKAVWNEVTSGEKTNIRIIRINDYYLYNQTMFQFLSDQFNSVSKL